MSGVISEVSIHVTCSQLILYAEFAGGDSCQVLVFHASKFTNMFPYTANAGGGWLTCTTFSFVMYPCNVPMHIVILLGTASSVCNLFMHEYYGIIQKYPSGSIINAKPTNQRGN